MIVQDGEGYTKHCAQELSRAKQWWRKKVRAPFTGETLGLSEDSLDEEVLFQGLALGSWEAIPGEGVMWAERQQEVAVSSEDTCLAGTGFSVII